MAGFSPYIILGLLIHLTQKMIIYVHCTFLPRFNTKPNGLVAHVAVFQPVAFCGAKLRFGAISFH